MSLVSIIIPAFNYGGFIGETLDSVRAQTHTEWECIVVDDGSTDDTPQVVADFARRDPRIRYTRQSNRGQPAARNIGLRAARGEYVQLLDADDLLESDKLRRHAQFLDDHPHVDIVYGGTRYFRTDCPTERRFTLIGPDVPWMPNISGSGPPLVQMLLERNIMVIHAPLTRHSVFQGNEVGEFDEALPRADDWDMWLRCAIAGKRFEFLDDPGTLALVRAHPQSLTRRDRRLLTSSLTIRRKAARTITDPVIRTANDSMIAWLQRVHELSLTIDKFIPAGRPFILVDDDQLRAELLGYPAIPFTERAGDYAGPPDSDKSALQELNRLRQAGAEFIVFAWPARWYLDHYVELRQHLMNTGQLLINSADAIVIHLGSRCR